MTDLTNISTANEAGDNDEPPRAWQRMLSGRRLDLLNPSPKDIEIDDIAHGLARVARWNGQTVGANAFSVAQHVLIVEEIFTEQEKNASQHWQLAALLHDAPEYVIGDLISPFKVAIGLDYRNLERNLLAAIHERFSLPHELPPKVNAAIKTADRTAAYFEATALAGFGDSEAKKYFGQQSNLSADRANTLSKINPLTAPQAQQAFLNRFHTLNQR